MKKLAAVKYSNTALHKTASAETLDTSNKENRSLRGNSLFLPDFCHIGSVFALVLSGQLLAFVLVLAAPVADIWQSLSLTSLLVQWILLTSAAVLCIARRWLVRTSNATAAVLSYALVLIVTALVAEIAYRLLNDASPVEVRHGFVLRAVIIAAIVAALVLRYLYVAHEWKRRLESEASARVEALQARIRPHFLFNSLNTIAAMIAPAPAKAEAAVEDLADLFRASLARHDQLVPLRDELALSQGYLRMEGLRLGARLEVEWEIDNLPQDALLPPLTLQPLLENAVYYGIEPRTEPGLIRIQGVRDGDLLRLGISNPYARGTSRHHSRQSLGMAQENIRQRLTLAFGRRASLVVSVGDEEYLVELTLPYWNRDSMEKKSA